MLLIIVLPQDEAPSVEFQGLLLLAVVKDQSASFTGGHVPSCFTDEVVDFGSRAVPFLLHTFQIGTAHV